MLSDLQVERYSRQILIPEIAGRGQQRLLASRVAIVGDDPLVPLAGAYLAAAGVGRLCVPPSFVAELGRVNPDCRIEAMAIDGVSAAGIPALDSGLCRNDERTENSIGKMTDSFFDVVISTQSHAAELKSLTAVCAQSAATLLWGTSAGCWAVLHPSCESSPCVECLLASWEDANPASSFWVASQLTMAAMSTILGLGLPENPLPHYFSALPGGLGETAVRSQCVHFPVSTGALVEAARDEGR